MKIMTDTLKLEIEAYNNVNSCSEEEDADKIILGFSNLIEQIKKRLDQDLPEISYELLQLVAPEQLLPIPPFTVVQLKTNNIRLANKLNIEKSGEIYFISSENKKIYFQTIQDTTYVPFEVISVCSRGNKIVINMVPIQESIFSTVELENIRFYCHGNQDNHFKFFRLTKENLIYAKIIYNDQIIEVDKRRCSISCEVFDDEIFNERLTKRDNLLRNMMNNHEKHFFLNLCLDRPICLSDKTSIGIELVFNLEVNNIFQPNNEYFKLNVIPVVNLYRTSSEPIRYDHKKCEYKIAVDDGCEVYRLLKVTALNPANGEEFEIRPFLENMC
ncbi:MAG: type VI secretion system baseplate subunit TssF, partial [Gammaproteobacteria bacterium]